MNTALDIGGSAMRELRACLAFFRLGLAESISAPALFIGRLLTLFMLIAIFDAIFSITPFEELGQPAISYMPMVWYLMLTELVIFSGAHFFKEVQEDVYEARLESMFLLPTAYATQRLGEWYGRYAGSLFILGLPSALFCYLLTGGVPFAAGQLPFLCVSLLLSGPIAAAAHFVVGGVSLWTGASEPVYWFWQKSNFVLGGLFLPVALFPEFLQKIAVMTPFPSILSAPASFVFRPEGGVILANLAMQVFWGAVMCGCAYLMLLVMRRRVAVKGG